MNAGAEVDRDGTFECLTQVTRAHSLKLCCGHSCFVFAALGLLQDCPDMTSYKHMWFGPGVPAASGGPPRPCTWSVSRLAQCSLQPHSAVVCHISGQVGFGARPCCHLKGAWHAGQVGPVQCRLPVKTASSAIDRKCIFCKGGKQTGV